MSDLPKADTLPYADPEANRYRPPLDSAARRSLIAGICFFLTPIPVFIAIVSGIVGIERTRDGSVRGRQHAIIGLSLGIAGVLAWILAVIWVVQALTGIQQVMALSHLKQLGSVIMLYSNDHQGNLPDSLESLIGANVLPPEDMARLLAGNRPDIDFAEGDTPQALIADFSAGGHCNYIYFGRGLTTKALKPDFIVAYEPVPQHRDGYVGVLFGDFHTEMLNVNELVKPLQKQISQHPSMSSTQPTIAESAN